MLIGTIIFLFFILIYELLKNIYILLSTKTL